MCSLSEVSRFSKAWIANSFKSIHNQRLNYEASILKHEKKQLKHDKGDQSMITQKFYIWDIHHLFTTCKEMLPKKKNKLGGKVVKFSFELPVKPLPFSRPHYDQWQAFQNLLHTNTRDHDSIIGSFGQLPPDECDEDHCIQPVFYRYIIHNLAGVSLYRFQRTKE